MVGKWRMVITSSVDEQQRQSDCQIVICSDCQIVICSDCQIVIWSYGQMESIAVNDIGNVISQGKSHNWFSITFYQSFNHHLSFQLLSTFFRWRLGCFRSWRLVKRPCLLWRRLRGCTGVTFIWFVSILNVNINITNTNTNTNTNTEGLHRC